MRKVIVFVLMVMFVTCFAAPSFAIMRKDLAVIRGVLISLDVAKNEVVVADENGKERKFVVKQAVASTLKAGAKVTVVYEIGTNMANWVKEQKNKK